MPACLHTEAPPMPLKLSGLPPQSVPMDNYMTMLGKNMNYVNVGPRSSSHSEHSGSHQCPGTQNNRGRIPPAPRGSLAIRSAKNRVLSQSKKRPSWWVQAAFPSSETVTQRPTPSIITTLETWVQPIRDATRALRCLPAMPRPQSEVREHEIIPHG